MPDIFARVVKAILAAVVLAVLSAVVIAAAQPTSAQRSFERFTREYLDHAFEADPVAATEAGDHRFDDKLPDYSSKAVQAEIAALGAYRTRLEKIPPASLPRDARQDRAILLNEIEKRIFALDTLQVGSRNPLVYTRAVGEGVQALLARDFAPLPDRARSALARMRAVPALLEQAKANLSNPPRVSTDTAILQNKGAVEFFEKDVPAAADSLPPELRDEMLGAAKQTADALRAYGWYLSDDLALRSNGRFRLGRSLFTRRLEMVFGAPVDPDSLYGRAMEEFDRTREEMYQLALPIHDRVFPSHVHGPPTDVVRAAIVREALSVVALDPPDPDSLLAICRDAVDGVTAFLRSEDLLDLTDLPPLQVAWMPPFSRGVAAAALDAPGPLDEGLRSFFFVSPVAEDWTAMQIDSYVREYNREMLRLLSIHEAVPGHYVQLSKANRYPSIVRSAFPNGAMVEGWAVYGEHWTLDAGYGADDPNLKLQELKLYLRTVTDAILDYRVHVTDISEKEAMSLLVDGAYQGESEARGKWTRARLGAGQLSTYLGGYLAICDLEAASREAKGADFNQKELNEAILSWGSPPVWVLRENLLGGGAP